MTDKVEFVDDLPEKKPHHPKFWEELVANPGRWAKWPGAMASVHRLARDRNHKGGPRFEARHVNGVAYIRCVKP
jgi:hypothetical protein